MKKNIDKSIEQLDYELKAKNKFPPDEIHPVGEQSKQKFKQNKRLVMGSIDKRIRNGKIKEERNRLTQETRWK